MNRLYYFKKTKVWVLLAFIAIILLSGCAIKQKIKYSIDDIQPQKNEILSKKKLNINLFEDIRNQFPENKFLFEKSRETKINGEQVCINSEEHYATETIPMQISKMIAAHLNKRGAFGEVVAYGEGNADYRLTGKIKRFYAKQAFSMTKQVIEASFGLIGALATAGIITPVEVEIIITDIKLYGRDGKLIKTLNDIEGKFNGNERVDSDCWSPYFLINREFKNVVKNLAIQVEEALVDEYQVTGIKKVF